MTDDWAYWFAFLAIMQGSFILGFSAYVFSYYFPKSKKMAFTSEKIRWHVVLMAASYFLLTAGTVESSMLQMYKWGDEWYYIISIAYILGDISLYQIFRHSVHRNKLREKMEKKIKDLEDIIDKNKN